MLGTTHALFAILFGSIYIQYFGITDSFLLQILFAALLLLGAMLPDLDSENATISKQHPTASKLVRAVSMHRGIMHSIIIPVTIYLISFYLIPKFVDIPHVLTYGLLLGYVSHLAADALTIGGLELFHPISKFKIRGFVKTGGKLELLIASLIVVYLLVF
ncbi:MAG: metal-dependent hydrolase [DPANN group archaeon]|nr:metal-dependent hydrolase [DPANN group archaeon]